MFEFQNITFSYPNSLQVICGFSVSFHSGERISFSGPSGCGKTTLLRLLLRLEKPQKGRILIPASTSFSAVFQENRLLPWKSVLDNVAMFSDIEKAEYFLSRLGLYGELESTPDMLSGGMQRRVALARALAHPFNCLDLDEAFTGLDNQTMDSCLELIDSELNNKTLILVSHSDKVTSALSSKNIILGNK